MKFLADDIVASQLAREAGARWQDAKQPLTFYRQHRPGEAHGIYKCSFDEQTGALGQWRHTHYAYTPMTAIPL